MVLIYLIEDINGLKYVGSTCHTLSRRLSNHRSDKKCGRGCTSHQLDLDNCEISAIDECDENHRIEREKHHISSVECVNQLKYVFDKGQYMKGYLKDNAAKIKKQKSLVETRRKNWINSFGGNWRRGNDLNNLLLIGDDLFQ